MKADQPSQNTIVMKHVTLSSRYGNPSVVTEISEVPKFVEGESV